MIEERTLDERCVNALRFLSVDSIELANSGHPGLPLGAAPMAYVLWSRHLKHDFADPAWPDRDRFVLSAGHGSALLYSLLHLFGYDVPRGELQRFRQWGSRTPGHPESGVTPGVEVTTGPLGQGFANAVGLAIAERHLAATFNRPGYAVVDHMTFALVGDGDLMEGVSYEAAAIAGHLRLGKLIVLYDSNDVCLAGATALATSEDVASRFAAAGWRVAHVADGNDLSALDNALAEARASADRPTLIEVKTVIGYGAPTKQGTHGAHGAPLGSEETRRAKVALGWPEAPAFHVPDDVRAHAAALARRAATAHAEWTHRVASYREAFPELAAELARRLSGSLPATWESAVPFFPADSKGLATRKASEAVLQAVAPVLPELIGGSADLNPSTLTWLRSAGDFGPPSPSSPAVQGAVGPIQSYAGRNLHFGVREHAMGSIANGIAQHGGLLPYTATFLAFADYMRPPIRLAALSGYPAVFVFTHDSIGVGEDGPTHQPVEQLMSLRLIPNLVVLRPADANETADAWRVAIERRHGPTVLVLTRQNLPTLDRTRTKPSAVRSGAYVLWDSAPSPELILMASGSEVSLALTAAERLAAEGTRVRVVSMPSWELFERQSESYRESVLPPGVSAKISIEAGRTLGWERYTGDDGLTLGVDRFGASAPGGEVFARLGLTADAVVDAARHRLAH
ncbi:MAG: transketolase [Candidatus Bipolaricaulis sp.]|nr:transketolase [Candidatus Bipolaricaulis sp.]